MKCIDHVQGFFRKGEKNSLFSCIPAGCYNVKATAGVCFSMAAFPKIIFTLWKIQENAKSVLLQQD